MLTAKEPASRSSSCSAACCPRATPTSGGSSESDTSESRVSPAACPPALTVTTLTGAGTSRINALSSSPATRRSYVPSRALPVAALRVREELELLLVRDLVQLRVEGAGRVALPEQDRRHSGAHHSRAVPAAFADRPVAVRIEAVAEAAAPTMRQEA